MSQRVGQNVPTVGTTSINGGNNNRHLVVKDKFYIHPTYTVTYTTYLIDLERVIVKSVCSVCKYRKKNNFVRFQGSLRSNSGRLPLGPKGRLPKQEGKKLFFNGY